MKMTLCGVKTESELIFQSEGEDQVGESRSNSQPIKNTFSLHTHTHTHTRYILASYSPSMAK